MAKEVKKEDGTVEHLKYTRENVLRSLKDFLERLLDEKNKGSRTIDKHAPTANKLNHLRDAITANMIGVISFLQKKYPGIIVLENLEQEIIKKQFEEFFINVHNRFEKALIEKFQTLGLVPPHVKNLWEIRKNTNYFWPFRHSKRSSLGRRCGFSCFRFCFCIYHQSLISSKIDTYFRSDFGDIQYFWRLLDGGSNMEQ